MKFSDFKLDKTGDGLTDDDTYGYYLFTGGNSSETDAFMAACDLSVISKDESNYYVIDVDVNKFDSAISNVLNLLRSEGNGDGGLFKGIFIRYFVKLALEEDLTNGERNKFAFALKKNAEALWKCGIDTTDPLFGPNWARTGETVDLGTHTSGATLIEAMALYETKTK